MQLTVLQRLETALRSRTAGTPVEGPITRRKRFWKYSRERMELHARVQLRVFQLHEGVCLWRTSFPGRAGELASEANTEK